MTVTEDKEIYTLIIPDTAPERMKAYTTIQDGASFRIAGDATFAVTNNLDEISPTGIRFHVLLFLMMLAAGLLLFPVVLGRKRKKEE